MYYKNEIIREFENYYIEVGFSDGEGMSLEFEIEEKTLEEYVQIIHKMIENGITLQIGSILSLIIDSSSIEYVAFEMKDGKLLVAVTMN